MMACHNTIKALPIPCYSMSLRKKSGCLNILSEVESELFQKLPTEPIEGEGMYVYGKLKTWKERIKTNFHGQNVPYGMYCGSVKG